MKRVSSKKQPRRQWLGPTLSDKVEIKPLVGTIEFIADDRKADRGQVHADLVKAAMAGLYSQDRIIPESALHPE